MNGELAPTSPRPSPSPRTGTERKRAGGPIHLPASPASAQARPAGHLPDWILAPAESRPFLLAELAAMFPSASLEPRDLDWVRTSLDIAADKPLPPAAFVRQLLPRARECRAASIRLWAELLAETILREIPETSPWMLHVAPRYGGPEAGLERCRLIREAVLAFLRKRRRRLLKGLEKETAAFRPEHALVQLVLTGPETGVLSVAAGPLPWVHRHWMSPFPCGEIPVAVDKAAPSRAFAKLLEAELRLGRRISEGETCVDLGASPGSWSYVAVHRGARVTAVDRAPLRDDLMRHPRLRFEAGDAFSFRPADPVDWLLCDVIAAPERSIGLLLEWVKARWCRRFIVTIKFKGTSEYAKLDRLRETLPSLTDDLLLVRLCANKNECCVAGLVRAGAAGVA